MEPVSGTLDASVLSAAAARSYESGAFDLSASPGLPAIELPFEIPGLPRGEGYVVAKATSSISWPSIRRAGSPVKGAQSSISNVLHRPR
jgi:hypothetical protein